jgi:ABC-type multidrug transport system permease subunit
MIAGTIPVTIDDAWLWALLVLFLVSFLGAAGGSHG